MGCQCSEPNKDKQVLVEENKQAVPEDDSNSKSNMNLTPQNDNNNNENAKEQKNEQEEHPQIQNSNPEPPKEEKKEEPSTPKEQENKDPNIEVIKEDNQEKGAFMNNYNNREVDSRMIEGDEIESTLRPQRLVDYVGQKDCQEI